MLNGQKIQPVFIKDLFHIRFYAKYFTHVTSTFLITPHFIVRKVKCRNIELFAMVTHKAS